MMIPQTPEDLWRQAVQLDREGRPVEAIAVYERLLSLKPLTPDAWYNLGQAQWRTRRFDSALASYERALSCGISRPEEVHLNRAVILAQHLGRADDAARELRRALELNARYVPALLNLGNISEQQGDAGQASRLYTQALQVDPANALALSRLPNLRTLNDANDPLIAQLAQAAGDARRPPDDRADLGFGLGKALNDVGRHDEAFAAYQAANQASRTAGGPALRYDAAAHERLVDRLVREFPLANPPRVPPPGRAAPIFICGMFRSGSTLIEQVLAAHPQVTAGGELDLIPALVKRHLPPGGDWAVLHDSAALGAMAREYLDAVENIFPGAGTLTDKRPDNFLHIGLIKTLFPDARIVCTRRDAVDNCLSVYFLHLSRAMPYALDLLDIAHWFRQHRRLMEHWKTLYGADIHEVDYDAFVSDPEPVARQLLAFCGLPWEAACLDFHRSRGVVRTASLWQVRQPLHSRASGRWRHYERHLAGLREALAL
jgi:Tfp pilus assembly protein PilF